jgi:hypothetical protein
MQPSRSNYMSILFLPVLYSAVVFATLVPDVIHQWRTQRAAEMAYQRDLDDHPRLEYGGATYCFFHYGKPLNAIFVPALPAFLVGGWGVIPSDIQVHLVHDQLPGHALPSTRRVFHTVLFTLCVFLQWTVIALLLRRMRVGLYSRIVAWFPFCCFAFGVSHWSGNADFLRLFSAVYWLVVFGFAVLITPQTRRLSRFWPHAVPRQ